MDPQIDPKTGKPIQPPANDPGTPPADPNAPPAPEYVPKAQFDEALRRLDAFESRYQFGAGQPPQQTLPSPPPGPSVADQIADIDKEINSLGAEIDKAIADEKPVSALLTKRDNLTARRTRLQIQEEDIAPIRQFGTTAIDQLSEFAASSSMDLAKKYDFVKASMDGMLNQLPAEQRTLQVRQKAYQLAVGENHDKIMEAQREEWLRENPAPVPPPGEGGRGGDNGNPDILKPEDVWDKDNLRELKKLGLTPETYVQRRGYKDWEDYVTQNADYFDNA